MFDFLGFFKSQVGCAKKHPIPFAVFLLVVVVFLSAPFVMIYRTLREKVPGAANVLPQK